MKAELIEAIKLFLESSAREGKHVLRELKANEAGIYRGARGKCIFVMKADQDPVIHYFELPERLIKDFIAKL